jgi:hypothetical protein
MADFILNAPGTVNNPYTPANIVVLKNTIQSDATGIFSQASGVYSVFAHNVNYGSVITSTITLSAINASDNLYCGAAVRSGANAGGFIGLFVQSTQVSIQTIDNVGNPTTISTGTSITWHVNDVFSCTVSISGGTCTVTASQNGSSLTFNANTTSTYSGESSLAAGVVFDPENTNGTKISQFTGTGVAVTSSVVPYKPPPIYIFS